MIGARPLKALALFLRWPIRLTTACSKGLLRALGPLCHRANVPLVANDRADLAAYYRQYLRLMEHWRAVLPADRFAEVDYEDATRDPEATARRLVAFCGLPWDPACLSPERNPDAVRTASKWQARQPIYRSSVERWRNYQAWLGELRELAPQAAPTGVLEGPDRVGGTWP